MTIFVSQVCHFLDFHSLFFSINPLLLLHYCLQECHPWSQILSSSTVNLNQTSFYDEICGFVSFFSFPPKKVLTGSCWVWDQQQPLYFYTQNPGITWHSLSLIWIGIISCTDAVFWTCPYWILYFFQAHFANLAR